MLIWVRDALKESSISKKTRYTQLINCVFRVFLLWVRRSFRALARPSQRTLRYKGAVFAIVSLFVPLSVLFAGLSLRPQTALATTSSYLNFQARLLNSSGSPVADGTYNIQFNLYTVSSGGSTEWTESYLNNASQGVTLKYGYFSVNLGSITSFPSTINWDQEHWLGMTVRGTGSCVFGSCTPTDSEMTPRFQLTAVPYAFQAGNALGVSSNATSTASTNSSNVTIQSGNATGTTSNSGNISINVGSATSTRGTIGIGNGANAPSSLTVGNTATAFTLQGTSASTITGTSGSFVSTLAFTTPTANQTYQLPNASAGTYTICTTANNCSGLGAYIQNTTGTQNSANFNIQSVATGSVTAKFRAIGSQTADILQVRDSTDTTTVFSVSPAGNTTIAGTLQVSSTATFNGSTSVSGSNTFTVGTGLTSLGGGLTVVGNTSLSATAGNTVGIGNSTGAVTVTGSSGSAFVLNAVNVSAAEFNVLDAGIELGDLTTQGTATDEYCLTSETGGGALLAWQDCGAGVTLQEAYDAGNSITTTDNRNILFSLADTATDADFIVDLLGTGNTFEVRDGGVAALTVVDGGAVTLASTLAVNGDSITADGATLTINAAGAVDIQDNLTADALTTDNGLLRAGSAGTNGTATAVGDIYAQDALEVDGAVVLGDATGDTITFNGYVGSSILPSTDDTYDLGDNTHRFRDLYLGGETIHLGTSTTDEAALGYTTSTNTFTLQSTGGMTLTTGAGTDLVNVLTGNLKVGNGTPGVTLNGEDLYVEGTLEVDGAQQFDGALVATSTATFNGTLTVGDAVGDIVTVNSGAWTFANDTTIALTGGVNGLNIDSNTLSIDATNHRVGFGTAAPNAKVDVSGTDGTELIRLSNSTTADSSGIFSGSGSPEGVVSAQIGSLYTDTTYGKVYKKTTGDGTNTGWDEFAAGTSADMAKMRRDAAQSLATSTTTKIAFDAEEFDVGGIADPTTNDRFDIRKPGKYLVHASAYVPGLDLGEYVTVAIFKNGASLYGNNRASTATDQGATNEVSTVMDLVAGDYLEMYIWHNEGASQNTSTSKDLRPSMEVVQVDASGGGNPEMSARVYNNAAQSIPNTTWTALTFNSERFDTSNIHSTSSNTSRLTAPTGGKYLITGTACFTNNVTGFRTFAFTINGTYINQSSTSNSGAFDSCQSPSTVYQLNAGDYAEFMVYQNSGGALNINSSANWSQEFTMTKIDGGTSSTLQAAYNSGNSITATDARDLTLTFADTTTDPNFTVNLAGAGDFVLQDAGVAFATFADTGAITFAPTSGEDLILNFTGNGRLDVNGTTYENNLGVVDIVRSTNFTGVAAETANELRIAPSLTVTEPASGTFTWNGTNIDMSGLAVTAGAGTTVFNGLRVAGVSDADAGTVNGILLDTITGTAATERALSIASGWDANIFLNDTTSQIQVLNTGVITFEDDAGNDLLTVTDAGTTGTVVVTGALTVQGDTIDLGVADTGTGDKILRVYGGGAGTAEGGQITLYTSADYDTTIDSYSLDAYGESLRIHSGGVERLTINASGNLAVDTSILYVDASNNCVGIQTTTCTTGVENATMTVGGFNAQDVASSLPTGQGYAGHLLTTNFTTIDTDSQFRTGLLIDTGVNKSSGTMTEERGLMVNTRNGHLTTGATVTNQYGIWVRNDTAASAVTTNSYGIYVGFSDSSTAQATSYGLYIADVPGPAFGVGNAIYQSATGDFNSLYGYTFINMQGTATTNGVCHAGADIDAGTNSLRELVACSAAPGDYAEFYPSELGVEAADIVATSPNTLTYTASGADPETGLVTSLGQRKVSILKKAELGDSTVGVISTAPYQTFGKDIPVSANRKPLALSGRVPVKVNNEGGAIAAGDKITLSSVAGVGKKATVYGEVTVGTALEPFNGTSGQIYLLVENGNYAGVANTLQGDSLNITGNSVLSGSVTIGSNLNVSGSTSLHNLTVTGNTTLQQNLTVMGDTTVQKLTVNGKIISKGDRPIISVETSATNYDSVVTVDGTDVAGKFTLNTGTLTPSDLKVKITFNQAYSAAPVMTLTAVGVDAASAEAYIESISANEAVVIFKNNPVNNKTYTVNYHVIEAQN